MALRKLQVERGAESMSEEMAQKCWGEACKKAPQGGAVRSVWTRTKIHSEVGLCVSALNGAAHFISPQHLGSTLMTLMHMQQLINLLTTTSLLKHTSNRCLCPQAGDAVKACLEPPGVLVQVLEDFASFTDSE